MNKKLISIGLTVLMTLTVLSSISGLANATTNGGFNIYTIGTDYANFTLPNYKVWQFGYNDSGRNMTNEPILAEINGNYGFIYQDSSNTLAFYNIKTDTYSVLTSSWQNYTIPGNYGGRSLRYWAARQNLFYTQLLNGNISEISSYGLIGGYFYVQQYNAVNNTYTSRNTTLPYTDVQESTWLSGSYQYNILPLTISNGTYEISFSESTGSYTDDNVSNGIYVWNIYSGKFYASNIGGLGVSETTANNKDTLYTISADMAVGGSLVQFDIFNWTTDTFDYQQQPFPFASTNNNMPFFIENDYNGTFTIELYQNTYGGSSTYGSYYFYYNSINKKISPVSTVSSSDTINDVETMANQEVYIFKNLVSGVNAQTPYISGYTYIAGAYFNYYNNSLMQSNLSWLNTENTKTGNPNTNVLIAETNNSLFYTFNAGSSGAMTSTTTFTVYWSPQFSKGIISYQPIVSKYNLEIKENGLPLSTQWTYTFNGTSYTLTNNSYNYSLVNGNYALSVSSVNGYNVAYPSTIVIDNASKIAYVNFSTIPKYTVHIKENGLPLGKSWNFTIKHDSSVIVSESLSSDEYNTSLQNGTYYLYAGSESGYHLNIHTSPFTVSGSVITEYVNYSAIPTYTLYLKESGLSSGTKWIAYVNSVEYSSTNEYINVSGLNNGTYSISIDNVVDYSLGTYPNSFTINGNNEYINVSFTHNLSLYNLKIIASGIKNIDTITWSVVFNSTTYSSQNSNTIIIPSLKNGSYSFSVNSVSGYITDKYLSTIIISGNTTERIYFNETFRFILHSNLSTTIVFNGSTYTTSNNYVNISNLVNGTYSLSINGVSGYSLSAYPSNVIINGNNYYLNITYTKVILSAGHYIVSFVMFGLPSGASWTVVINNIQYYSSGKYLNVSLVNGTYYPDIIIPNGYYINSANILIVNGHNTNYTMVMYPNTVSLLTTNMPYIIIFLFIIFALVIVLLVKRRD